ncbi:nucleotide sugar dehydrogenase [Listeria booriae]|uniref:Nucleotide sugar dehydrogenase n=1 Tax=Listeria booriae TaxID=1552123 RepID=A0A7X1CN31_9LIST|nr:nucleotide sugar dehydrogenase [Listeria booriae]MBC1794789.1 nucleotide sugar dehydrogenase [Listeria booriae]MBC1797955.1 nucleotide sugar dehydrogenase [Listeria booriae]MBC1804095.1 nucleotide sugar dehydrogenase [Listeria booriae]MBC1813788.1 nucleotide sugar dehydrogenase [Listeria booriae]MBC2167819.1 nucleotide sugar dehydrogenase [Listeria booriae]
MKLVVIGLGYIGLPTAIMFANHNQDVVGIDVNKHVINELNEGKIHIEEPGLQAELDKAIQNKAFRATMDIEPANAFIVSVPTPNHDDALKSCDLTYVKSAVQNILPVLRKGNTIIIESTIAPRSTEDEILPLVESTGLIVGKDVFLVHCPERVLPGQIIHELIYNNRIIGGVTPACTAAGKAIYSVFVKGELIEATASTAEMSKLMENTYRDVNIALANELVHISAELNINALDVIDMANKHPRVNLHQPGPGVGGHCLAVDPYFIAAAAPEQSRLIQDARHINTTMPDFIVANTVALMKQQHGKKIAVFGLTYKGDIDDIRESPALEIYDKLKKAGTFDVVAYDPHVQADFVERSMEQATTGADMVLILADHTEFRSLTGFDLANMKQMIVLDTKNIIEEKITIDSYFNLGNIASIYDTEKMAIEAS